MPYLTAIGQRLAVLECSWLAYSWIPIASLMLSLQLALEASHQCSGAQLQLHPHDPAPSLWHRGVIEILKQSQWCLHD